MKAIPLIACLAAGVVASLIWLVAMAAEGTPWGGLALLVGAGVSAAAIFAGARPRNAVVAALVTLLFCLAVKAVGIPIATASARAAVVENIKFTEADYTRYQEDARVFATLTPDEALTWLAKRPPYDSDSNGVIDTAEKERFDRFWAPRLRAWAARPSASVDWAASLREDWGKEVEVTLSPKELLAIFFAPLEILALLLAVIGTHQAVYRMAETDAAAMRRVGKVAAGVFDLNEDIGSGIDIKMAAPGQKSARTPEVDEPKAPKKPEQKPDSKPDPKAAAKPDPKAQKKTDAKPVAAAKPKNPNQPPGMK